MKRYLLHIAISSILLMPFTLPLRAQDYEIEINSDKKIIYVDKLSLPGDMALVSYLMTLPELADNDKDTFLSRYDIELDGHLVSDSRDALLASLFLRDIKEIHISSSPSKSHIKNGLSGTINIKPVTIQKGFSGNATLHGAIKSGFMPSVNLSYSDGAKFEARADFDLDIYFPTSISSVREIAESFTRFGDDTLTNRWTSQMARIYSKWQPNRNDEVKVWFWQNYTKENSTTSSFRTTIDDKSAELGPGWQYSSTETYSTSENSKSFSCVAIVDYTHQIKTGELNANFDYHYNSSPGDKSDALNVELKNVTKFYFSEKKLTLNASLSANSESHRNFQNSTFNISPLLKLSYDSNRIKAAIEGRYKAYSRTYGVQDMKQYSGWYHDWTCDAGILWQVASHHALRLHMTRNFDFPSSDLIYPEPIFDPKSQLWRKGNPDLKGPVISSANIEYITDWARDAHKIIFDIRAEYNHKDREINYTIIHDSERELLYTYPVNTSHSDIVSLSTMLSYANGPFSMTLGGNFFYNTGFAYITNLKASYFNLQFCPTIQLKRNWLLNAGFLFNSKMYKENVIIGSSAVLNMGVNKTIGKWTLFASIQDIFDWTSTDQEQRSRQLVLTTYDPFYRSFNIGANFKF